MRRNTVVVIIVVLTVTGMLVLGRHLAKRSNAGIAADAQPIPADVKGVAAPDFELESITDGRKVKLSDYRGKAVVLSFWATWCEPCKIEMPWLVEFQKKYGNDGLQVVGVAYDDTAKDEILQFARNMGVNYPVLQGKNAVADLYGVQGMPNTTYIGRDGKMLEQVVGLRSKSEIEDNIKAILGSKAETKGAGQ